MKTPKIYQAIGTMSGSSCDGLDIACCEFIIDDDVWSFDLMNTYYLPYDENLKNKLKEAHRLSLKDLCRLNASYGIWLGKTILAFMEDNILDPLVITSHGHTVLHEPSKAYSLQIGSGAHIAEICNVPVVNNIRNNDIACNGQGAPLTPVGDYFLFSEYDVCLNLGGIANISANHNGIIGYDICPCNMLLDHFSNNEGLAFDEHGTLGKNGMVDHELLSILNNQQFYTKPPPRSIDRVWFEELFLPLFSLKDLSNNDLIRSAYEHISIQISSHINSLLKNSLDTTVLLSGGGTKNEFLIQLIKDRTTVPIQKPNERIIDYKEAIIMAFLGLLRLLKKENTIFTVTGANKNCCSGALYYSSKQYNK